MRGSVWSFCKVFNRFFESLKEKFVRVDRVAIYVHVDPWEVESALGFGVAVIVYHSVALYLTFSISEKIYIEISSLWVPTFCSSL